MQQQDPCTEVQMMIRKPAFLVYEAFIDPAITTKFWFTHSSGRLDEQQRVTWKWEMYQVSSEVMVKNLSPGREIVIEWGNPARNVSFAFQKVSDETTCVVIKEWGYSETGDELLAAIKDSTGGFTTVIDGLKAWLEQGIALHLIGDKFATK